MKKALTSLLALLLAAALLAGLSACGGGETETPTTTTEIENTTTQADEAITTGPDEPTGEEASTQPGGTTAEGISETQAGNAEGEGVPSPVGMSKPELIAWYNERVNHVREAKPGMTREETLKILEINLSLLGGAADGIVNYGVSRFMPGDAVTETRQKGAENKGFFFGDMARPVIRESDAKSITAKQEGGNYVVTLLLVNETNPLNDGVSTHSRVASPATRQDVLDTVAEIGVSGDIEKAALYYHSGKLVITVNPKGEIIRVNAEFFVDADCKQVKWTILTSDLTAKQYSQQVFTNFVY